MDRIDDWLRAGMHATVYLIGAAVLTFLLGKLFHRMRRLSAQLIRERGGPEELEWEKQSPPPSPTSSAGPSCLPSGRWLWCWR